MLFRKKRKKKKKLEAWSKIVNQIITRNHGFHFKDDHAECDIDSTKYLTSTLSPTAARLKVSE